MDKHLKKLSRKMHLLGQYDGFWTRRLNTMVIAGNGASLVVLSSYMNDGTMSLDAIQNHIFYFLPFITGLLLAAFAVFCGMMAERAMLSHQYTLEEAHDLGYINQLDPREFKFDTDGKYYSLKHKWEKYLFISQLVGGILFLIGVILIAFIN